MKKVVITVEGVLSSNLPDTYQATSLVLSSSCPTCLTVNVIKDPVMEVCFLSETLPHPYSLYNNGSVTSFTSKIL